jgi:MFS transporter, PAT family, beta-lactamase induction signal transducer AmpG
MGAFMTPPRTTSPLAIFFLVLPYGISSGYATVTLPFVLTQAGFPVAVSASIVAIGISSNIWRFLWGPVADLTLTPRRWYLLGTAAGAATLLLLGLMPLRTDAAATAALTTVTFISQVAATFVVLPVGGLIAYTVPDAKKGMAGGWYQAGNLGGAGLGGGAGVWLASHFSVPLAGAALAAMMMACALALLYVPDLRMPKDGGIGRRFKTIGADFRDLLRSPLAVLAMVLVSSPVGSGALTGLWSAVAPDWKASPDLVALASGLLSGVVSAVGCLIGGWVSDHVGRWWSYLGSGVLMGATTVLMAFAPRTPALYLAGVLVYALTCGMCYAAFSALLLYVIGRGAASTKYATLSSLGNLPTSYMTAFDGWAHDRWGAGGMLHGEAILGVGSTALILVALGKIKAAARAARPAATAAV